MKKGKSAGVIYIPAELVQAGGGDRDRCFDNNLQQDQEKRRMSNPMDSVADCYTP